MIPKIIITVELKTKEARPLYYDAQTLPDLIHEAVVDTLQAALDPDESAIVTVSENQTEEVFGKLADTREIVRQVAEKMN